MTTLVNARSLDSLALAARAGDPAQLAALLPALAARLMPLVRARVRQRRWSALGPGDVDDLVQELVLKIWQRDLPHFDPTRSGFLTFVTRRLEWHLADAARKARRRAAAHLDEVATGALADDSRGPQALLEARAREQRLLELPGHIDDAGADAAARRVLIRHDLEGATLTEIAAEMNLHVSNVCRARQRGLRQLARYVEARAA